MEIREHMDHAYARCLAYKVGHYLKDRYGARKVLVFGSLVTGFFNPDFLRSASGLKGRGKTWMPMPTLMRSPTAGSTSATGIQTG